MNHVSKTLSQWLNANLHPNQKLLVAYSGGRDSHVLLDALVQLKTAFAYELEAIHVHHVLQAIAASWPGHCQAVCDAYDIPLRIINLALSINPGESLEEKARTHRYEAFALQVCANTLLLTAHTQDDQAETFLLQMMRGSGIQGLASIAPNKPFSQGVLARPLLSVSREQIAAYALQAKLQWIEDPSNHNLQLRRNFIRKKIVLPLEHIQPNVSQCIARSATHCQQALTLLEEYLAQDMAHCIGDLPSTLKVEALKAFTVQKQTFILRHWLSKNHCVLPNSRKCQEMLKQLLSASLDANPQVMWGKWQLRRYQKLIYLFAVPEQMMAQQPWEWDLKERLQLADGTLWQVKTIQGAGLSKIKLVNQSVQVRFRKGGERINLSNQANSKSLKKIFQEYNIPPWERAWMPLFYVSASLIAVGQRFIAKEWQVSSPLEEGFCFEKVQLFNL